MTEKEKMEKGELYDAAIPRTNRTIAIYPR